MQNLLIYILGFHDHQKIGYTCNVSRSILNCRL